MDWLTNLLFNESVGRSVLIVAFVISIGSLLGKIRLKGISLGSTFVLFVGIVVAHFGFTIDVSLLHFLKDFGLILFVFGIGLQVGPNFFSSFKQEGLLLNGLALGNVCLNVVITIALFYLVGGIDFSMLIGVMSGAVTNTPGLGAAQQALNQLSASGQIDDVPIISLGYAVAYPMGVIGIILGLVLVKKIFNINLDTERAKVQAELNDDNERPERLSFRVTNPKALGVELRELKSTFGENLIFARVCRGENCFVPQDNTILVNGDLLRVVAAKSLEKDLIAMFGERISDDELNEKSSVLMSRRILITNSRIAGKKVLNLHLRQAYNVNVTRVYRSGIELVAADNLSLRMGDKVMVVGEEKDINMVEKLLGNSVKHLNEPNLVTFFLGIFVGIIVGAIPIAFPGLPQSAKLGLAGGPLIVSLLIGAFGHKMRLVCYTTQSANIMIREIGISLFLACVGLEAGCQFFDTLINGDGLRWVALGLAITMIPMLITSVIARGVFKLNYFSILGLISGGNTNPPALAYSNMVAENDRPSVAYSTVYPLSMFLRIVVAQSLILFFV